MDNTKKFTIRNKNVFALEKFKHISRDRLEVPDDYYGDKDAWDMINEAAHFSNDLCTLKLLYPHADYKDILIASFQANPKLLAYILSMLKICKSEGNPIDADTINNWMAEAAVVDGSVNKELLANSSFIDNKFPSKSNKSYIQKEITK